MLYTASKWLVWRANCGRSGWSHGQERVVAGHAPRLNCRPQREPLARDLRVRSRHQSRPAGTLRAV